MKVDELRDKKYNELQDLLKEQREKLRGLRFQLVSRQLKDVRALRLVKRTIAKILTLLNNSKKETSKKVVGESKPNDS